VVSLGERDDSPDLRRRPTDLNPTVAPDGDPLVAIQNAALDRALCSETDSSAYVLLAGALERARSDDVDADARSPTPPVAETDGEPGASLSVDGTEIDPDRVAGSLLTATLTATLAVRHELGTGGPPRPPSPAAADGPADDGGGDRRSRLLLEGALLAVERVDATTAEAAALANVGVAAFERHLDRRS
jgi:hypothetical protein